MLCNVCLALVNKLDQLHRAGHTSGRFHLRELTQVTKYPLHFHAATYPNTGSRVKDCHICTALPEDFLGPSRSEAMEVMYELNARVAESCLEFWFCHDIEETITHFFLQQEDHTVYEKAARSRLSSATGGDESLELAAYWFKKCRTKHRKCNVRANSGWYPRRLLDLKESKPRLMHTAARAPDGPYATMSHCWGTDSFAVLTAENMKNYMSGIPLTSFLPSFRHAMTVAKYLGVLYIWIDSYCIVQKSESGIHMAEKLLDVAQMGEVYANSILNLGAGHAHNPHGGCFAEHQKPTTPRLYYDTPESKSVHGVSRYHLFTQEDGKRDILRLQDHQLFTRAWVFQEKILCPRMLHFGRDQLYYECQELPLVSENFPRGYDFADFDYLFALKLDLHDDQLREYRGLAMWAHAVRDYSRLQLTHPAQDKFVAVAGIAQLLAKAAEDEYLAGFLRRHFTLQLCWKVFDKSKRAETWRAPSWSWASVEAETVFIRAIDTNPPKYTQLAHVREVKIELVDPTNQYGGITSGQLILRGRLIETSFTENVPSSWGQDHGIWTCLLSGGDNDAYTAITMDDPSIWPAWRTAGAPGMEEVSAANFKCLDPELYILPLCLIFPCEKSAFTVQEVRAQKNPMKIRDMEIGGLLVQKLSSNHYIRRGAIEHVHGFAYIKGREALVREWDGRQEETIRLF